MSHHNTAPAPETIPYSLICFEDDLTQPKEG